MVTIDPETGLPEVEEGYRWQVGPSGRNNIPAVRLEKFITVPKLKTLWQNIFNLPAGTEEVWQAQEARYLIISDPVDAHVFGEDKLISCNHGYGDHYWAYKELTPEIIRKEATAVLESMLKKEQERAEKRALREKNESFYGTYPPKRLDTDTPKRLG